MDLRVKKKWRLQWISSFQASSKVESGMRGLPAWHTNKLPASIVVGTKLKVLTVTFPSGDVFSSTELRILKIENKNLENY